MVTNKFSNQKSCTLLDDYYNSSSFIHSLLLICTVLKYLVKLRKPSATCGINAVVNDESVW